MLITKTQRSPAEFEQIKSMIQKNHTFVNVFRKDWTKNVIDDLSNRLYGKIPRNFLINLSGLIGTPTGIFKSTLGLQLALTLDPMFTIVKRVAFSINELLDLVRNNTEFKFTYTEYAKFVDEYKGAYDVYDIQDGSINEDGIEYRYLVLLKKLIFFLDEKTRTLKMGGMLRLQNLVDTCRQRQICFITCGVDSYDLSFSTYDLMRIQESSDDYLPEKQVRYAVYDRQRDLFYGYFKWNIWELSDPLWNNVFDEYSQLKTKFQRIAISQQISSMDYKDYGEKIIEHPQFDKCFSYTKDGKKRLLTKMLKLLVVKEYPDFTNDEREYIMSEVKLSIDIE